MSNLPRSRTSVAFLLVLPAMLLAHISEVDARMYQWSHAATGTVQLSGSPPAWYRSATVGPRIFVFDNGRLVDDTAIAVAEDHRRVLRARAVGRVEAPATNIVEAEPQANLRDALRHAAREGVDIESVTDAISAEHTAIGGGAGPVEQTVVELKALLDAWDERRLNEAKALLEGAATAKE